jgi:endo-1,4-beta-xylanase
MRQIILIVLAAATLPAQSLREQADRLGMLVGGAVDPELFGEADYANAFATQLNMLEPENDMKFEVIHPEPGVYNFVPGDQIVAFAQANGQQVRGHNLVWYSQISPWVTSGNYTPAQLNAILQDHINTVVSHYAGQVFAWDVVNEAMSDSPPALRSDIWYNSPGIGFAGQGTKYIEQAFVWARAADPNALLFYNDYGADVINAKSNAIYAMAQDFRSRGVPLDGIGLQMHLSLTSDLTQLGPNIQRYIALGLQVHITELDVEIPVHPDGTPIDPNALQKEAALYQTALSTCLRYKGCTAFQTWGLTDKYSWIPGYTNGADGLALPLDVNYQPKPAYYAMIGAFQNAAVLIGGPLSAISATNGTVMLAPDGLASLYGAGLAGTASVQVTDSSGAVRPASLLYVSPSQINCLIPAETLPGPATLTVSGNSSLTASITTQTVAPGLFSANANGQGVAAANAVVDQTPAPIFQCGAAAGSCVPIPISVANGPVYLELFGTGIRGRSSLDNVNVTIGNLVTTALYAGLQPQYPGLDQVNVLLPASLAGAGNVGIQLEIDGRVSNLVQITIK